MSPDSGLDGALLGGKGSEGTSGPRNALRGTQRPVARFTVHGSDYAECLMAAERQARAFFLDDDWDFTSFEAWPATASLDGTVDCWKADVEAR